MVERIVEKQKASVGAGKRKLVSINESIRTFITVADMLVDGIVKDSLATATSDANTQDNYIKTIISSASLNTKVAFDDMGIDGSIIQPLIELPVRPIVDAEVARFIAWYRNRSIKTKLQDYAARQEHISNPKDFAPRESQEVETASGGNRQEATSSGGDKVTTIEEADTRELCPMCATKTPSDEVELKEDVRGSVTWLTCSKCGYERPLMEQLPASEDADDEESGDSDKSVDSKKSDDKEENDKNADNKKDDNKDDKTQKAAESKDSTDKEQKASETAEQKDAEDDDDSESSADDVEGESKETSKSKDSKNSKEDSEDLGEDGGEIDKNRKGPDGDGPSRPSTGSSGSSDSSGVRNRETTDLDRETIGTDKQQSASASSSDDAENQDDSAEIEGMDYIICTHCGGKMHTKMFGNTLEWVCDGKDGKSEDGDV